MIDLIATPPKVYKSQELETIDSIVPVGKVNSDGSIEISQSTVMEDKIQRILKTNLDIPLKRMDSFQKRLLETQLQGGIEFVKQRIIKNNNIDDQTRIDLLNEYKFENCVIVNIFFESGRTSISSFTKNELENWI